MNKNKDGNMKKTSSDWWQEVTTKKQTEEMGADWS